ncbi:MAG: hypothetical protein ACRENT_03330 [Thermodesulfobacteriota bacterium]
MTDLIRLGISLSSDLLDRFDKVIEGKNFLGCWLMVKLQMKLQLRFKL